MKIKEGEAKKWWYGFAWRNYSSMTDTALPIPINLIARFFRRKWIIYGSPDTFTKRMQELIGEARSDGYRQGRQELEDFKRRFEDTLRSYQTAKEPENHAPTP